MLIQMHCSKCAVFEQGPPTYMYGKSISYRAVGPVFSVEELYSVSVFLIMLSIFDKEKQNQLLDEHDKLVTEDKS